MSQTPGKSPPGPSDPPGPEEDPGDAPEPMPPHVPGSGALDRLVETARDYARAAAPLGQGCCHRLSF